MTETEQVIINLTISVVLANLAATERKPDDMQRRANAFDEIRAALQKLEKYANK